VAKVVLGIGNILLRDEGIGCHVVHALESVAPGDARIIDGGTCPDVVRLVEDTDKLVIVDAVKGGGMPGQIYRFRLQDVALQQKPFLSVHDFGLLDNLMLMKVWERIGEDVIIGVEPKDVEWGLELSAELQEKIPQIIEAVLAEVNNTEGERKC
jgi:hydrogenase maturation protease